MQTVIQMSLFVLAAAVASAQTSGPIVSFTATTENVSGAHDSIRIDVFRWSTDAEHDQFLSAWNLTAPPATTGGRGGRGASGRGNPVAAAGGASGRAGRGGGRAGRGGRGGRGGEAPPADAPPPTPESSLAAALGAAPPVGHLWSSEVAGYSLRSAIKLAEPNGGERIVLITDRRLGAFNDLWKPVGAAPPTNYEFSVIELHLNSKGEGEGKASLTGKVAVDSAAKTIGLEDWGALPVVLKNVRRK